MNLCMFCELNSSVLSKFWFFFGCIWCGITFCLFAEKIEFLWTFIFVFIGELNSAQILGRNLVGSIVFLWPLEAKMWKSWGYEFCFFFGYFFDILDYQSKHVCISTRSKKWVEFMLDLDEECRSLSGFSKFSNQYRSRIVLTLNV